MNNLIGTLEGLFAQYSDGKPNYGNIGSIVSEIGHEAQKALLDNGISSAVAIVLAIFSPHDDIRVGLCERFKNDRNFVRFVAAGDYPMSQEEETLLKRR